MRADISSPDDDDDEADPIADAAARWTMRHDRGLTASEQDEFSQWLAADPRHRAAWAEHRWGWKELDRLVEAQSPLQVASESDLPAARSKRRMAWTSPVLAAAALVILGALVFQAPRPTPPAVILETAGAQAGPLALIEQRELPDGSIIDLNRGAVVTEHYTAGERRVRLERGEAHFKVAKDANRPFYVEVRGIAVRAVGTAFGVRLAPTSVEVLVTEGRVGVQHVAAESSAAQPREALSLTVGQRTVVSLVPSAETPQVIAASTNEVEAWLAWQPQRLDFTDTPLPEIVEAFNRRNPVRLTLGEAALGRLRLSATFRSDNVEGFVRLMESDFGMRATRRGNDEIVLMRAVK